jgi:hypothetical protein
MKESSLLLYVALLAIASPAASGAVSQLPEPGSFELLALGGVVALIVGLRKRFKK